MISTTASVAPDLSTDASAAQVSISLAQHEFANAADKSEALEKFNKRVSWWSNQFTDLRLKRWAFILGSRMKGETHTFQISQSRLIWHYERWHQQHGWHGHPKPNRKTLQRWTAKLVEAEIVTVNDGAADREIAGERQRYPGLQNLSHTYAVNFGKVLVDGQVQAHDFMSVAPVTENVPSIAPSNAPSVAPSVVPHTLLGQSSETSSATPCISSSERDGEMQGALTSKVNSTTPQRPPSADPAPASGGVTLDGCIDLATKLSTVYWPDADPAILPKVLGKRFYDVAKVLGADQELISNAVRWWIVNNHDDYPLSIGAYLNTTLPDVIETYQEDGCPEIPDQRFEEWYGWRKDEANGIYEETDETKRHPGRPEPEDDLHWFSQAERQDLRELDLWYCWDIHGGDYTGEVRQCEEEPATSPGCGVKWHKEWERAQEMRWRAERQRKADLAEVLAEAAKVVPEAETTVPEPETTVRNSSSAKMEWNAAAEPQTFYRWERDLPSLGGEWVFKGKTQSVVEHPENFRTWRWLTEDEHQAVLTDPQRKVELLGEPLVNPNRRIRPSVAEANRRREGN